MSQVTREYSGVSANNRATEGSGRLGALIACPPEDPSDHASNGAVVDDEDRSADFNEVHTSTSWTLLSRSEVVNGFSTTATPGSRMPLVAMASTLYPDIKSTLRPGRFFCRLCARSRPDGPPGITTSVRNRSMGPPASSARRTVARLEHVESGPLQYPRQAASAFSQTKFVRAHDDRDRIVGPQAWWILAVHLGER